MVLATVDKAEILAFACRMFNELGGKLYKKIGEIDIAECGDYIENGSRLLFRPIFYTLGFKFKTLNRRSSLRLFAKSIAMSVGKLSGTTSRLNGLEVFIEVASKDKELTEIFLLKFQSQDGICVGEVVRNDCFGNLIEQFNVGPKKLRDDNEDSFDNDEQEKSSNNSRGLYT